LRLLEMLRSYISIVPECEAACPTSIKRLSCASKGEVCFQSILRGFMVFFQICLLSLYTFSGTTDVSELFPGSCDKLSAGRSSAEWVSQKNIYRLCFSRECRLFTDFYSIARFTPVRHHGNSDPPWFSNLAQRQCHNWRVFKQRNLPPLRLDQTPTTKLYIF
jgi:hypothetical protein